MKNLFRRLLSGFTLIEMSFVLLIMGLMMVAAAAATKQLATTAKANEFGDEATLIINAANSYTAQNFEALINGVAVTGVVAEMSPTITELKTIGLLPAGVSTTNSVGTGWKIALSLQPTGCIVPACDVSTLIYTDAPILNAGAPDTSLMGQAMVRVGGNAGMSTTEVPASISGKSALWVLNNPLGSTPGIFGVRGGFGASGYSQFVRNGDSRNISLAGNLSVAGSQTIAGNSTITGSQTVTGVTNANGGLNTTNINATGNATVAGNVTAAFVGFTGYTSAPVIAGNACSPNGKTGVDAYGALYSCVSLVWTSSSTKPCVHGSYSAIFSGSNPVTIPPECTTVTIAYLVGAGSSGSGVGAYSNGTSKKGLKIGGGAGGTSGQSIVNQIFQNTATSGKYTVTVGAGGTVQNQQISGQPCYYNATMYTWDYADVSNDLGCYGDAGESSSIVSTVSTDVSIVAAGGSVVGLFSGANGTGAISPGPSVGTGSNSGSAGTYVDGSTLTCTTISSGPLSGYQTCGDNPVSGGNGGASYFGLGGNGATVTSLPATTNGANSTPGGTAATAAAAGAGGGGGGFCGYNKGSNSTNLYWFRPPTNGGDGAVSISW